MINSNKQKSLNQSIEKKLKKFIPTVPLAKVKIFDLIDLGAIIIAVDVSKVTLKRHGQTATVDSFARVEWLPKH